MREFTINKNDSGQRLDKYLTKSFPLLPQSLMYKYIRSKRIKVNSKRSEISYRLKENDVVTLYINDEFFEPVKPRYDFLNAGKNLKIVYEDENIILIDKPAGLLSHPDEGNYTDTAITRVKRYLYEKGEYNPDSETILYASKQDYQSFYDEEIEIRKMLIYPPFCEFINFVFSDANINKAKNTAKQFYNALKYALKDERVVFYPICEAPLFRINNNYRFRFLIKTRYSKKMYDQINELYRKHITKSSTRITIDVNPSNMN